jgi:hypothetical protein
MVELVAVEGVVEKAKVPSDIWEVPEGAAKDEVSLDIGDIRG